MYSKPNGGTKRKQKRFQKRGPWHIQDVSKERRFMKPVLGPEMDKIHGATQVGGHRRRAYVKNSDKKDVVVPR